MVTYLNENITTWGTLFVKLCQIISKYCQQIPPTQKHDLFVILQKNECYSFDDACNKLLELLLLSNPEGLGNFLLQSLCKTQMKV